MTFRSFFLLKAYALMPEISFTLFFSKSERRKSVQETHLTHFWTYMLNIHCHFTAGVEKQTHMVQLDLLP